MMVFVRVVMGNAMRRRQHMEAPAGQSIGSMLDGLGRPSLRQAGGADGFERAVRQIRPRVQHGGQEHIAGDAAYGVQMNVHAATS
jgi:hypothetical protein